MSVHSPLDKFSSTNILCEVFNIDHRDIKKDTLQEFQVSLVYQIEEKQEEKVITTYTYDISDTIDKINEYEKLFSNENL